jgi:glycosyltransferase involved in cell wall biosynthesis
MEIFEKDITLLIPAKDEEESLPIVLKKFKNLKYKILIVLAKNDLKTYKAIKKFNCKIVFQKKKGYGAAIKYGINLINTEYLCIFNADVSFSEKEIFKMTDRLKYENRINFVFGSRYSKNGYSEDDTFLTYIGNKFFTFFCKFFFKIKLSDILYTYVLGKTVLFKKCKLKENNFCICVELPLQIHSKNFRYSEISSYEKKRIAGIKKVNEFKDGFLILYFLIKTFIKNFSKYWRLKRIGLQLI